jgi:hypothetical protein
MGRAESTNLTQIAHPAMFIRFAFQLGSLCPIISIHAIRSAFLNFLSDSGSPRYVHGKSAIVQAMEV